MTTIKKQQMTIFFADIAGSVELYDSIGDTLAHEMVVACLNRMSSIIESQSGRIIEIIGDEIMAAFEDTNQAIEAATQIQIHLMQEPDFTLGVRIGFHSGLTAEKNGHPYGDTVNIAARMVNLGKSTQIMTNHQTVEHLSETNKKRIRFACKVFLKGKPDEYTIYEVVWDESEPTMALALPKNGFANRRSKERSLYLKHRGNEIECTHTSGEVVLGRGLRCDLFIDSDNASRFHALVNWNNGKMVLKDQSTNGTYIRTAKGNRSSDGIDLFIHQEEWRSDNSGVFSLGVEINDDDPDLVHFRIA